MIPLADRPTPHLTNLAPSGLFPAGISIIFVTMMNVIFFLSRVRACGNCSW
ncbi:hypothetical protein OL548_12275 [Lysinibacillus sp. MHQ-1]|nr:hypothetical protein OL548_12275 [Lysinibacillus sp. MHQ-1]